MAQNTSLISELSDGQRVSIAFGVLALLGLSVAAYLWLYRVDYQPIYQNLAEEDAANVITQLQERKVPYRVSDGGRTILVDSRQLEETKVLMDGGKLSIRGGDGFELFDDIDYGMTEFAQKINYQRALQGEISRTIIGLTEVRYARVHLVLPERALFKKASQPPKASITVVLESGQVLSTEQVRGIQELVGSAVEGMEPNHVTILNEQGVVLSRSQYEDDNGVASRLGQKQEMERYLEVKTERILNQVFGPGLTVVNIDASLSYDQVQLTRETYEPSEENPASGLLAYSKVQRQYQENGRDGSDKKSNSPLESETVEYDYRLGKSVEQVVRSIGAIERLTVSVMVPDSTPVATLNALRQLVGNAVGLRTERGDSIEIYALPSAEFESLQLQVPGMTGESSESDNTAGTAPAAIGHPVDTPSDFMRSNLPYILLAIFFFLALLALPFVNAGRKSQPASTLSEEQRQALLADVRDWLEAEPEQRRAPEAKV